MNICIFQGTFNPIHNAHLRIGEFLSERFDKIIFIPAFIPPHKDVDIDLARHRYNMVKLAIEYNKKFDISDIEYKRGGKSYTYLTICEIYKKYDIQEKINFIIGTDAFKNIQTWYETEKLKKMLKFLVFKREDKLEISEYNILRDEGYDFEFQSLPYKDISSTELREKIKNKENTDNLLPPKVKEYIEKNELYQN